ncbi:MAG: 23S rRNA (uracil(1939)-C(5))-methyltransferase RlmD [Ruminococcaceae bacterium]|nr:23S rRNA (uracil(1939)-C(5))-methyltransferase RlmD [Oscillospiraceae bacterium]
MKQNNKDSKKIKKVGLGNGCPHYKKCGGCQLQNMTYDEQLSFKQAKTIRLLGRFCHIEEIIGMRQPEHYRNKVQAAFGMTRGGKIISGVYQSSSHNIVCVDNCRLEDRKADRIIVTIRKMLGDFKMLPYNEDRKTGFLRHVLVKRGFATGEIMVVLVTSTPVFKNKNAFISKLLEVHPEITTIVQNINNANTSLVLGESEKVLYGKGYITDILCGCKFKISAKSFYQINPVQTEKLYNTAIEYADLKGDETVIDAYCGIGTIGMVAAKNAGSVVGVELNKDAVRDAIVNAKLNEMKNIYFYNDDAGKFMVEMAKAGEKADVVFMDPPRAGSDMNFLSSVVRLAPKKVVYISCNPETQARDLAYLVKNGYQCKKIQPVDMFPHTAHVETVVLLSQRRPDTHIVL